MDLYTHDQFLESEIQRRTTEATTAVRHAREASSVRLEIDEGRFFETLRRFSERNFDRWLEPAYGHK